MKRLLVLVMALFFSASAICQVEEAAAPVEEKKTPNISQYWFVMIKTGPKKDFDSTTRAKLFAGHMSNMEALYNEGILKVAGPFGKNSFDWRGIFILDCKTKEEAEKYVLTDPAVKAGLFSVEIVPWYTEPSNSFKPGKP